MVFSKALELLKNEFKKIRRENWSESTYIQYVLPVVKQEPHVFHIGYIECVKVDSDEKGAEFKVVWPFTFYSGDILSDDWEVYQK